MGQTIVSLAKELIARKSEKMDSDALREVLDVALRELKGFTIERFESNGSVSILAYAAKKRPEKFTVILNGHLDVMPGKPEQYQPFIKGDRLYGVGAMDMKAGAACLIEAFKNNARRVNYPLGLQLVTDEQLGGMNGTRYQIDQGVRANFVISGESTNLNIAHQSKGILWAKITFKGSGAHSAYPWKGKNPVWDMHTFMQRLKEKFPLPTKQSWVTTVAVSNIETDSTTFNKTPGMSTVWLDVRYVAEASDTIVADLKKLLPKHGRLDVLIKEPAMYTPADNPYVLALKEAIEEVIGKEVVLYGAQGSSDARHYARVGAYGVELGPVGAGTGSDDEWVSIKSLETYLESLDAFLKVVTNKTHT